MFCSCTLLPGNNKNGKYYVPNRNDKETLLAQTCAQNYSSNSTVNVVFNLELHVCYMSYDSRGLITIGSWSKLSPELSIAAGPVAAFICPLLNAAAGSPGVEAVTEAVLWTLGAAADATGGKAHRMPVKLSGELPVTEKPCPASDKPLSIGGRPRLAGSDGDCAGTGQDVERWIDVTVSSGAMLNTRPSLSFHNTTCPTKYVF
jgi:hypothetical protein